MMRSRGQLWSLDVVLSAVVFTLAIGIVLSQSELHQFYGQQDRLTHELRQMAIFASNGVASKPDVMIAGENFRCGPNFDASGGKPWIVDNELSPLDNCLIDSSGEITRDTFGLPAPYAVSISAPYSFSANPGSPASVNDAVVEIPRRLLYFPDQGSLDAVQIRKCLDGTCDPSLMQDVSVRVWRT